MKVKHNRKWPCSRPEYVQDHQLQNYDEVIKLKRFPRYWPCVQGIHRSPVNSPHKGQWGEALMFSFICAWLNGGVNNGEVGDLRRHRAHYDVIVMCCDVDNSHFLSPVLPDLRWPLKTLTRRICCFYYTLKDVLFHPGHKCSPKFILNKLTFTPAWSPVEHFSATIRPKLICFHSWKFVVSLGRLGSAHWSFHYRYWGRLTEAYDVKIQRKRKSHKK